MPYLVELMDATPTAQNVEEYARLTRQELAEAGGGQAVQRGPGTGG